jgi:hypothetical protein
VSSLWQIHLFAKLAVQTEERGSEDVVEQSDVTLKKQMAQKIQQIPSQHHPEQKERQQQS